MTLGVFPSTSVVDQLNSVTTRSSIKTHNSTEASNSHVTTSISVSSTQSVAVTETQQAVHSTSQRTVLLPSTSSSDLSAGPLDTSFTEMKTASEFESLSVASTLTPVMTGSNGAVVPSQTKSTLTYGSDALSRSVAPDLKYTADYISTPLYSTKVVAQKPLHHSTASLGTDLGSSGTHNY